MEWVMHSTKNKSILGTSSVTLVYEDENATTYRYSDISGVFFTQVRIRREIFEGKKPPRFISIPEMVYEIEN